MTTRMEAKRLRRTTAEIQRTRHLARVATLTIHADPTAFATFPCADLHQELKGRLVQEPQPRRPQSQSYLLAPATRRAVYLPPSCHPNLAVCPFLLDAPPIASVTLSIHRNPILRRSMSRLRSTTTVTSSPRCLLSECVTKKT